MAPDEPEMIGRTGVEEVLVFPFETRVIVIAEGIEAHEKDLEKKNKWKEDSIAALEADPTSWENDDTLKEIAQEKGWKWIRDKAKVGEKLKKHLERFLEYSDFMFCEKMIGSDFSVSSDRKTAKYINYNQRVHYSLRIVHKKSEFIEALETPGISVIYQGHSRYGRGACFGDYDGVWPADGDIWGDGVRDASNNCSEHNGIFRMGYSYVPVEAHDISNHKYKCAPIPVESGWRPPRERWDKHPWEMHPDAWQPRNRYVTKIEMPEACRSYVYDAYRSPTNKYFGYKKGREPVFLMHAGWKDTRENQVDLDKVDLQCRAFCHFGCSSRLHYWNIVRKKEYKNWRKDEPPTTRLAYFTTNPSDSRTNRFLYRLLTYDKVNDSPAHFYKTYEHARKEASKDLFKLNAGYGFY